MNYRVKGISRWCHALGEKRKLIIRDTVNTVTTGKSE